MALFYTSIIIIIILIISIKQINEYERGVKFRLGRYLGMKNPGWRIVVPIFERLIKVDLRTTVVDVQSQEAVSKDNISIKVNAVLYYKVTDAKKAILEVEHYNYAVSQLSQTTMRNIVGEFKLDEILQQRETISKKIEDIVDKATDPWGIKVEKIEIKDIELPEGMKRVIGRVAEAERERKATILKAEGEVVASKNLAKASETLAKAPGALHLRTLQTLNDLSGDKSNTVVLGIPLEILRAYENKKK